MKAVRIHGPRDIRVEEIPVPVPQPEEALVKVSYVGLCGTDIQIYTGRLSYIEQGLATFPIIPGHEWSGIICEVGSRTKLLKRGDRVCGETTLGCGSCHMCMAGRYNLCRDKKGVGVINKDGGYAEYLVVPSRSLHLVPETVSLEEAALTEPAAVASYGVERAGVSMGDKVLIIGDGPIGLFCLQVARLKGASEAILVGSHKFKMDRALELGATHVLSRHSPNLETDIMSLALGVGPDVIFECSGDPRAISLSIRVISKGGRIALLGHYYKTPLVDYDFTRIVNNDVSVFGVLASPNMFGKVLDMMRVGAIRARPLISEVFPLVEAPSVMRKVENRELHGIKYLFRP